MATGRGLPALSILIAMFAGCTHLPMNVSYDGPTPVPPGVRAGFGYERIDASWSNHVIEVTDLWTLRSISLESSANLIDGTVITVDLYDPLDETPAPLILVLPTLGGDHDVATIFAEHFARHGFATAIVHRQEGYLDFERPEELNDLVEQSVLDHRQALDLLLARPGIDAERVGLFGLSAGAIKGSIVAAVDPRIGPTVLGLAGGDVPSLFAYGSEGGIVRKRRAIKAEHGLTQDDIHRVLTETYEHDPLDYARYLDARRTLLILARFDAAIPYRNGLALRDAIGGPQTIVLPVGHYGSAMFVPYIQSVTTEFFTRELAGPERQGGSS